MSQFVKDSLGQDTKAVDTDKRTWRKRGMDALMAVFIISLLSFLLIGIPFLCGPSSNVYHYQIYSVQETNSKNVRYHVRVEKGLYIHHFQGYLMVRYNRFWPGINDDVTGHLTIKHAKMSIANHQKSVNITEKKLVE